VVFMGHWGAEERHDAVPEHLIDGALKAVHGVHHDVQRRIEEPLGGFRVEPSPQLVPEFIVCAGRRKCGKLLMGRRAS